MFSKYYSQMFIPFINNMFKPNTGYYYLTTLTLIPMLSYWNLLTSENYSLPINLILISITVMLLVYAFSISMLLQNEDNCFNSLEVQPSIFALNFSGCSFVVIYFVSYFIGLLLIKKTILGGYTLPYTFLFSIPSLFFGLSIANYGFHKYNKEKNNKDMMFSFILITLLSGMYFAIYFFIPSNISVFVIIVLVLASLLFYFHSAKLIRQKIHVK